jgi:N-methylhydantoinase B/oxoprolinase/acetone carboxylase alpha subunit
MLKPGETVTVRTPGGGGYGAPGERKRADIEHDLARGYITTDAIENYRADSRAPGKSLATKHALNEAGPGKVER